MIALSDSYFPNDYARLANLSNHWVDFAYGKMNKYIEKFGENFNVVIYWTEPNWGYYSIPFVSIKHILTKQNTYKEEGERWMFTIENNHILYLDRKSINLDISQFYNTLSIENLFAETVGIKSNPEGERKLTNHYALERDTSFVRKIKQAYYEINPDMPCQICGESYAKKYGELGIGYIEAHHIKPLSELKESEEHKADDFMFVCANCHRMLHRTNSDSSGANLKAIFKKKKRK